MGMWHACMHDFDRESLKERARLEDLGTDGKITLHRVRRVSMGFI